jgi:Luciferase-like monooxygenase
MTGQPGQPGQPGRPRFRLGFLTHVQGRADPATTYRNAQELFVVADELGFDVGWVAQHHAPLGGGGLPSPWTFLAHAAARTRRIRLSTAITVLPLENPVRLAEDVSVVDLLSGGRVEIGVGSGGNELEYAVFGRDIGRKRELTTEAPVRPASLSCSAQPPRCHSRTAAITPLNAISKRVQKMNVPIHPVKRDEWEHSSVPKDDHGDLAWDESD